MRACFRGRVCGLLRLCAVAALVVAAEAQTVPGAPASSGAATFRAGAQAVDISPTKFPVRVNGMFTERSAGKVVDRLFAKALALDDGTTRLVWCVVDSCMMPRDLIDAAKAEATKATGVPTSHMLVSATHTHSAPSAMGCLGSRADPDYVAWLPGKIAQAIIGAVEHLQPVRVGWTVVDDWDHTFNRRWIRRRDRLLEDPFGRLNVRANMHPGHESPDAVGPSGPVDPGLSLLAVETPEGKPLALFANYSQHYYGSELLSSDYFGLFAGEVASKLGAGGEFVAAMSQGTSGDLASMDYSAPARRIGYESYAEEIAERAVGAYRRIAWHKAAPLKIAERTLPLSYRVPDPPRLAWAKAVVGGLGDRLPQNHPEVYAWEAVYLHEKQKTELKLQALRIGDLGVTAIPNEVYAITGLKLKAQSPLIPTFNVGLANGSDAPPEITAHYQASGLTPPVLPVAAAAEAAPPSMALSPAESMKKTHVRAGYRLELAAAEPLTMDPVAIDWDAAGRLWVVEMADYPNGMDGKGAPGGRVRVLEDENGDGRYDKSTLLADGLQMPTGLLTWRDGVLVTTAPEIIFLKDSDGDGRADVREVLYSGFQVGNPQLRVNGLRWGLDNWIYCAAGGHHGAYGVNTRIRSHRTGTEVLVGSRDTRVRPDTGELEPESGPSQFGRNRDEWGRWFGTQNSFPLWHYVLADHYLRRNPHVPAPDPVVQVMTPKNPKIFPAIPPDKRYHSFDEAGHFTSGCSGMVYGDELLFPRSQETHAFACEPFHNVVHHELVSDEGVSFRARRAPEEQASEFFASEDRWVRPVMTRTGPDGALWVVDMYRAMIEHPEWLPPEGRAELLPRYREGDDKGRIYRIVPGAASARKPPRLDTMSVPELVAALDSPNVWQRDKIQQLLVWRQEAAAVPGLEKLARESRNVFARLHALCTLDGLNALSASQVEAALGDLHPGARENALRLAQTRGTPAVVAAACRLVSDPDAKVRLQLAFTLGEWKQPEAGVALGQLAVANSNDRHLVAAVMSSALPHAGALVDAVVGANDACLAAFSEPLLKLSLALNHRDALARLLKLLLTRRGGDFSAAQMEGYGRLLDLLAQRKMAVEDLAKGDDGLSQQLRGAADLFDAAQRLADARGREPAERVIAASLLARDAAHRAAALPLLAAWLVPQSPPGIQRSAVRALASTGDDRVPALLVQNWTSLGPEARIAILDELLSREPWAVDLLTRVEKGQIAPKALDASRRSRLLKHSSAAVRASAARILAGSAIRDRAKVVEQFRPALGLKGEPTNGRAVFLLRCASCHRRDESGNDLGPDLRSVTAHEPERLLAAILDPSADVQPGFEAYQCRLSGGEELYGIITAETATSLMLKLADASTRTVLRSDIVSLVCLNNSLMPEGLEAGLSAQDMADLIAFLRDKR